MNDKSGRLTFDIRGQVCPSSLLITLQELNLHRQELRDPRWRLVVLTDNRDATATIPEATRSMGYEVEVLKESGHYRIEIGRRREGEPLSSAAGGGVTGGH